MPGLFGAFFAAGAPVSARSAAASVSASMLHHPDHVALPLFAEGELAAGLVLRRAVAAGGSWEGPNGARAWIDGEAFGEDGPLSVEEIAERLFRGEEPERLDGAFVAVLHEPARGRLRFISDPHGLKYLYLRADEHPAWCGELSGFLNLPGHAPEPDPQCLDQILRYGHPLGETTWFRGVELLGPGTVATFDMRTRAWSRRRYFCFEDARTVVERQDLPRAIEEMGTLFRRAVARRASFAGRVGLTLSGGLDSRALLAAIPSASAEPPTVTFGAPGCDDERLAARAAAVRGSPHVFMPLGGEGWLEALAAFVPLTDGHISVLDLHGIEILPAIEARMDVCLHGFLGDALLGGSYLDRREFSFTDQYRHRGRRFVLQALHFAGTRMIYREPFLDLELTTRVLSLPQAWLKDSRLYRAMLLREFPAYFDSIPWQKTGLPISTPAWRVFLRRNAERVSRRLPAFLRDRSGRGYTDYAEWLRQGSAAEFMASRLGAEARLHRFRDRSETESLLREHARGEDRSAALGRRLAVELWLRHAEEAGARARS